MDECIKEIRTINEFCPEDIIAQVRSHETMMTFKQQRAKNAITFPPEANQVQSSSSSTHDKNRR
ncbi:unnamed protein product [Spirodela intermedia]|uniref:Uncharacterized protein n=1 Tax=Spirodela intermedia TaxID=51605 RepID=A0A7I8IJT9_SPIIN|nr:unnamed protein product [Spirodela intermedia]CAA6658020.1 unnamed protein product [Spirodela intermedia]